MDAWTQGLLLGVFSLGAALVMVYPFCAPIKGVFWPKDKD